MYDSEEIFATWYRDIPTSELNKPQFAKWELPVYFVGLVVFFAVQIYLLST